VTKCGNLDSFWVLRHTALHIRTPTQPAGNFRREREKRTHAIWIGLREVLRLLPRKVGLVAAEMAVRGGRRKDRAVELEVAHNAARAEVKVLKRERRKTGAE
jgi:hypothetical protein